MKKIMLFLAAILLILSPVAAAQEMSVTWEWVLDDPEVNFHRYQLDSTSDDGWILVDGQTSSYTVEGLDPYTDYTLYLQRSYDGVNWSETAEAVAEALLVDEVPPTVDITPEIEVEEVPAEEPVIEEVVEEVVEPAPVEEVEEAPVEELAPEPVVEEIPAPEPEPAPVEEVAPVLEAPVVTVVEDPEPVVEEVVEEVPHLEEPAVEVIEDPVVEEAPVEEVAEVAEEPVEEAEPASEEPVVEEAPVEEAPVEEAPVEEAPAEDVIPEPEVVAVEPVEPVEVAEKHNDFAFSLLLKGGFAQPLDFTAMDSIHFNPAAVGSLSLDFANIIPVGNNCGVGLRLDAITGSVRPSDGDWAKAFSSFKNAINIRNYGISYDPAVYLTFDARAGIVNFNLGLGFDFGMMYNSLQGAENFGYNSDLKIAGRPFKYQMAPAAVLGMRFYMGDMFSLGIEGTYRAVVGDWLHHDVTAGLVMGFTF